MPGFVLLKMPALKVSRGKQIRRLKKTKLRKVLLLFGNWNQKHLCPEIAAKKGCVFSLDALGMRRRERNENPELQRDECTAMLGFPKTYETVYAY